jgi:membrane-bound acyltransferase YfiQ involved in biofilm formation
MSFAIYMLGFVILLVGVAWGLITAGVPQVWVIIACIIMLGLGIMTAVTRTKPKDPQQR